MQQEVPMQVSEAERNFYDGFQFALLVVDMLPKTDAVLEKLRTVVSGELSLMASPDEVRLLIPDAIRKFEEQKGSAATDAEKELIRKAAEMAIQGEGTRAQRDGRNKILAEIILRVRQVQQQSQEAELKKRLGM
jgi:hypothetical protein